MPKILLVEDNEMNRDMLSRRLDAQRVRGRDRGRRQQGVDLATSEKPDLILMDHEPAGDGWLGGDAPRQGRSGDRQSIPVIALTANAMVEDREKAMAAGCDDFDTKPVELPRLLEKINGLLNKK